MTQASDDAPKTPENNHQRSASSPSSSPPPPDHSSPPKETAPTPQELIERNSIRPLHVCSVHPTKTLAQRATGSTCFPLGSGGVGSVHPVVQVAVVAVAHVLGAVVHPDHRLHRVTGSVVVTSCKVSVRERMDERKKERMNE